MYQHIIGKAEIFVSCKQIEDTVSEMKGVQINWLHLCFHVFWMTVLKSQ